MEVISSIVGSITTYILVPIGARFGILRNLKKNIVELEKTTVKLDARSKDEQGRIEEAKRQERVEASEEANLWFNQVSKAVSDANNLKAEYDDQTRRGACLNCSCRSHYQLSKKALKLKQDVDKLYAEDPRSGWTVALPPQRGRNMDTVSIEDQPTTVTVKREIIDAVLDDRYVVVGLYGMGGVGKTTLLRHVNEYFRYTNDFESVIFTTVSATPNLVEIRNQIVQSLGRLSATGKYLLILDDMWDPIDLAEIYIHAPKKENGCKILMASRSLLVVTKFVIPFVAKASLKSIPVNSLPQDEAWKLFVQKVGEDITSKPEIEPFAYEVLRKCGGLPLAIIVLGGTMSTRETEGEWKDAVRELEQHSASNLEGMDKIFWILMFSFEKLEQIEQSLFLYCCLFPEDYHIAKRDLFDFAMGEETLLCGMKDYKLGDVRNKVDVLVGKLRNSSMLEDAGYGNVKMHDVMRELGLWITSPRTSTSTSSNKYLQYYSTKFIAKPRARLTEAPDASEWHKVTRISLMDNDIIESLPDQLPHLCPQLHTLLLRRCTGIKEIPQQLHFLDHMPALRILDLSWTWVKYLPPSISHLVNLRVLCLNNCPNLQELPPEIGLLVQLISLDLSKCYSLRKLPLEMKRLKNLRRLDIWMTLQLKSIPCGVLSGLLKLEEFDADGSGLLMYNPSYIEEWSQLTRLTSIDIPNIRKVEVSHWLKPLAKRMPRLHIQNCAIDTSAMPDLLEDSPDFSRKVRFTSCKGLTSVPTRGCNQLYIQDCPDLKSLLIVDQEVKSINAFESLCNLELERLDQLETICSGVPPQLQPGYGCFTNLEEIRIMACPNLKELFTKGVTLLLKKLKVLKVYQCSQLVKLISDDDDEDLLMESTGGDDAAIFPSMKEVRLCELPELRATCHLDLKWPSLTKAHVYRCPNLRRPPFGAQRPDILLNDELDSQMTEEYRVYLSIQEFRKGIEHEDEMDDDEIQEDGFTSSRVLGI